MYLRRQGHVGLPELCLGTGDAVAGCTELSLASLAEEHLGILRKVRAQGPSLHTGAGVLEAMPDACPTCAGMVLDHLKCVLMPETCSRLPLASNSAFLTDSAPGQGDSALGQGIVFSGDV